MSWTAHKIVFRLNSPMHIGWKAIGNVRYTRGYVPGWVLWGAITARLTRMAEGSKAGDYQRMGNLVKKDLRFSSFFFSEEGAPAPRPWSDGEREFSWLFESSYASTALQDGYTKEDGSLHETELIAPYSRESKQTWLSGLIFERNGGAIQNWRPALKMLQIGGERSYGWGRIELLNRHDLQPVQSRWTLTGDDPIATYSIGDKTEEHVAACASSLIGLLEPVVRRLTNPADGKFGAHIDPPEFCWAPGSQVVKEFRAKLAENGILKSL